jgi:flagellar assembly protein FliH
MSAATKFTFDTEFRSDGDVPSSAARTRQKKSLTQDEIDHLCTLAREQGTASSAVRAQEAVAQGAAEVAKAIREAAISVSLDLETVRAECTQLAMLAAGKLAQAAIASAPSREVEAALRHAMHQAIGEPRILLRASPEIVEAITPTLSDIAHEEGFDGRIQATADPSFHNADCRIEWRGGGAERVEAAIESALADLIARRFSAPAKSLTEDNAHDRQ